MPDLTDTPAPLAAPSADDRLDEALGDTFPASDPVSLFRAEAGDARPAALKELALD